MDLHHTKTVSLARASNDKTHSTKGCNWWICSWGWLSCQYLGEQMDIHDWGDIKNFRAATRSPVSVDLISLIIECACYKVVRTYDRFSEDELSDFPLKSVRIWKEIVTALLVSPPS